ncbi:MAG: right-handed parallel beta-helix repeat-containing protein [Lentisphaeria bacterium]|nr:right-handed parallel beta-helix repeat-containing protein [Lentisphaeria bacterium]
MSMKKYFLLSAVLLCSFIVKAELAKCIKAAIKEGKSSVTLEKKIYSQSKAVKLQNVKNFTIDGNGATLIIQRNTESAFKLVNCENVTIKNITVDYSTLPFTQGRVTKVEGNKFYFTVDKGYPALNKNFEKSYIHLFTPDGEWKKSSADVYGKLKAISADCGVFTVRGKHVVEVNDKVAVNFRSPSAFSISRCGKLDFKDITIHASPGVAFHSRYGRGKMSFDGIKIVRTAPPAGADAPRLFACCADGINLATSSGGAVIKNCEFSYLGDDGINFHSELLPVAKKRSANAFATIYPYGQFKTHFEEVFKKGDEMIFVRQGDYKIIARAHLESIKVSGKREELIGLAPKFFPVRGTSGVSAYEITMQEIIDVPENCFFYIPASGVAGFEITNNYFHDHRARGIRIMSSNGVIADNRFERLKGAAVTLGGEFNYWRESGWCSNITIKNNIMREIGYSSINLATSYTPGVISTFARLDGKRFVPVPENRNLVIENNIISDSPGAAIFLYAADTVTLRNNKIEKCATSKEIPGKANGYKNFAPIWLQNSKNIKTR